MKIHETINAQRLVQGLKCSPPLGFCTTCGAEHKDIHPLAGREKCSACGICRVYGAESLLQHPQFLVKGWDETARQEQMVAGGDSQDQMK